MLLSATNVSRVISEKLANHLWRRETDSVSFENEFLNTLKHAIEYKLDELLLDSEEDVRKLLYECALSWGYTYAYKLMRDPSQVSAYARHNPHLWQTMIEHFNLSCEELEALSQVY